MGFFCVLPVSQQTASQVSRGHWQLDRHSKVGSFFDDQSVAIEDAIAQAKLHPQQQFAVMCIASIYETASPKVIKKIINDQGEMVLEKSI